LQSHPSIHAIEQTAFFAILLFRPLDDGIGALGIVGAKTRFDEEIPVDRGAASGKQHERQYGKERLRGNTKNPPCRNKGGGA
jgi:hypothetical protein